MEEEVVIQLPYLGFKYLTKNNLEVGINWVSDFVEFETSNDGKVLRTTLEVRIRCENA